MPRKFSRKFSRRGFAIRGPEYKASSFLKVVRVSLRKVVEVQNGAAG